MSGIYVNSDGWNFCGWGEKSEMNEEGLRKDVEFYAGRGGVEAVFYNLNYQRAYFNSRVFDHFASGQESYTGQAGKHSLRQAAENLQELQKNCPDFIQRRYRICHENHIEMWHSMRMNDIHFSLEKDEYAVPLSSLWRKRKDLLRAWYRRDWRKDPQDLTFDYGKEEVRKYHLALVREYLLDYESDGLEIDWLRALPLFRPGFDECNRDLLTQFMREVRQLACAATAKWGHRVRIAVRVPFRVDEAVGCGMDVSRWCQEDLVDIVIPGPNNTGNEVDPQLAVWRMLIPRSIIFAPCIDFSVYNRVGTTSPCEAVDCALASSFYELGADTLYLYNHFPCTEEKYPQIRDFLAYAHNREAVSGKPRRHIALGHDPAGESRFIGPLHPLEIWPGRCNGSTKIHAGEGNHGRQAEIRICFSNPVEVDVLLNTVFCPLQQNPAPLPKEIPPMPYVVCADVPENILHDGWNAVELFNRGREIIYTDKELLWMEIFIK